MSWVSENRDDRWKENKRRKKREDSCHFISYLSSFPVSSSIALSANLFPWGNRLSSGTKSERKWLQQKSREKISLLQETQVEKSKEVYSYLEYKKLCRLDFSLISFPIVLLLWWFNLLMDRLVCFLWFSFSCFDDSNSQEGTLNDTVCL